MEYKFNTQFQQPHVGNEILHNAKTVLVLGILSILGAFIYIVPGLIFGIISIS